MVFYKIGKVLTFYHRTRVNFSNLRVGRQQHVVVGDRCGVLLWSQLDLLEWVLEETVALEGTNL